MSFLPPHAITLQRLELPAFPHYTLSQLNRGTQETVPPPYGSAEDVLRKLSVRRPSATDAGGASAGDSAVVLPTPPLQRKKSVVTSAALQSLDAEVGSATRGLPPASRRRRGSMPDRIRSPDRLSVPPSEGPWSSRHSTGDASTVASDDDHGGIESEDTASLDGVPATTDSMAHAARAARLAAQGAAATPGTAEELTGSSILSVVQLLSESHNVSKRAYHKCLISHAFIGTAQFVVEERRIAWVSQPLVVTAEIASIVDAPVNIYANPPPAPWDLDVTSLLPEEISYPFELTMEVPNTAVYRTCQDCIGTGTTECPGCYGNPPPPGDEGQVCSVCNGGGRIQCPVCVGHGFLRLFLMIRCIWNIHVVRVIDSNGYPLNEPLLRMCTPLLTVNDNTMRQVLSLPAPLSNDLLAFFKFLKLQCRTIAHETQAIRHFQCRTAVYPMVEAVYLDRSAKTLWTRPRRRRWLVVGSAHNGNERMVLRINNDKQVAPWLTYEGADLKHSRT
ncbi:hypothetical protein GGF31_004160 [Allomyces arbusculus]|nr:hypothetical protein GGF31_004160 [Allomyces arbusculus]